MYGEYLVRICQYGAVPELGTTMGKSMKKVVFAAALAAGVAVAGGASAADLGGGYGGSLKDEPVYAPAPIWSGYYIGGHLGGLWNDGPSVNGKKRWCHNEDQEVTKTAVSNKTCYPWKDWTKRVSYDHNDDDTSLVGGVHVGHNWQSGARVFGLEGDVSFADGLDYLASMRARLGYARGNLLLYLTGGVAFAGFDAQDVTITKKWGDHTKKYTLHGDDDRRIGYVVGAGAEYKLRPNMSIGVEALYYDFGDSTKTWNWIKGYECGWKEYKVTERDDNDLFVVRGRLTYHFQDERDAPLK